ncbi:hypothetical protein ACJIZ3_011057 [Penstemon smallii]|uniref:Uncharacterized protein n=1 Tax=Penstemon smallii TaxID=265156 RepID=A0ABD3ULM4_9LAMI
MSLALSLCSHFLKHLTPFNSSATFSAAFRRQFIRLSLKNSQKLLRNINLSVVNYSTSRSDVLSESLVCFGASSTTIDEQDNCISRASDSVGFNDIPNYEVEMHDHTDWIKQSQVIKMIQLISFNFSR